LLGAGYLLTSFENNGPSRVWVRTVGIYQSFAGGRIELKAGFMPNYFEYVGFYTGGSPVLSNGIAGTLPIQAGLSADPTPTPLVNLTVHGARGLYLKVGVQRSVSPNGSVFDARNGSFGIKFSQVGAGPLTIGEIGIRRPASAKGMQIWLRAGYFYNNSDYKRFDGRGTSSNQVAYGLADIQLTQPDRSAPGRGFYVGGSAYWADPKVSTLTQTYEGRVYDIGFLPSRPKDSITARVTYNKYSDDAQTMNEQAGLVANGYQLTASISYSYHVANGIYVTPALSYIKHPSFIGAYNDAVNAVATVYFLL
jgi:carbohydrate-selective porin OprB